MEPQVLTHGITEVAQVARPLDYKREEFQRLGYCVLKNVVAPEDLRTARERIDEVYEAQAREVGGADRLSQIKDADIARSLLAYDEFFLRFITCPEPLAFLKEVLGQNFSLCSQVAILNRPRKDIYQYAWHRDLNYQHFVCSRPLAVQALYCIDDFTAETGGTVVLPGSHLFEEFPSEQFLRNNEVQVTAPAGSAIMMNSMVYHRTGRNRSAAIRRGLNHIFTIPMLAQQVSLPKMLNGRHADDPELRRILGYEWGPADSVLDWRSKKFRKSA
jgi:ectoine hydroxylase-related dioxygenase (phytanoyl-CoA dioxygenase family)